MSTWSFHSRPRFDFCDPASPWQRGSNENTNGLLRQYFPKGTDLSGYHSDYLEFVSAQMNRRPRETLGWKSPAKDLNELLSKVVPNRRCCNDRLNPPLGKWTIDGKSPLDQTDSAIGRRGLLTIRTDVARPGRSGPLLSIATTAGAIPRQPREEQI
jgi:hypothetical protein